MKEIKRTIIHSMAGSAVNKPSCQPSANRAGSSYVNVVMCIRMEATGPIKCHAHCEVIHSTEGDSFAVARVEYCSTDRNVDDSL